MPGMPFGTFADQSQQAQVVAASGASPMGSNTSFLVWLVVLGVILPAFILGGLQMGGFSFVFRHR